MSHITQYLLQLLPAIEPQLQAGLTETKSRAWEVSHKKRNCIKWVLSLLWAIYCTARTQTQRQICSSAVPQGTGRSETSALTYWAAPGRQPLASAGGKALRAGHATGVAAMCVPLCPAGTNPTMNSRHYSGEKGPTPFLWNTSNSSVLSLG